MQVRTLISGGSLSVYDFRCTAGPADRPFVEAFPSHVVSYVRRGSFGCVTRGESHELAPGALLVGRPGVEYMATHEHHGCGDECLSVKLTPELADSLDAKLWDAARVPPLPQLMVLGELAQAAAEGRASVGVDEAALLLVNRAAQAVRGNKAAGIAVKARERERRRVIEAALWIEAKLTEEIRLEDAARQAGLSPFHFLRLFAKVIGATPHQYLVRLRLKRAAKLLAAESTPVTEVALEAGFADLSNFVRTFRRAAGVSPREFRQRKIFQERIAA